MKKQCYIIAGPNGAGKTTFANEFLPIEAECLNFINADLIASGLSPFQPEKVAIEAGRIMLRQMDEFVSNNESFAFEKTGKLKNTPSSFTISSFHPLIWPLNVSG